MPEADPYMTEHRRWGARSQRPLAPQAELYPPSGNKLRSNMNTRPPSGVC